MKKKRIDIISKKTQGKRYLLTANSIRVDPNYFLKMIISTRILRLGLTLIGALT
jgi:hypothetical protein